MKTLEEITARVSDRVFGRTAEGSTFWPTAPAEDGHREASPSSRLAPFLERLFAGAETVPDGPPLVERVLPDGAVHLIFSLGDRAVAEGVGSEGVDAEVLGPTLEPHFVHMAGRVEHVVAVLRPGAIGAVLGVPAAEITGRAVPLEALWGPTAREARERLAEAPTPAARMDVLERVVGERVRRNAAKDPDKAVEAAVRRLAAGRQPVGAAELAELMGVGSRRVAQRFEAEVGIAPRTLARLLRFRRALARLHEGVRSWSGFAQEQGYYDQAHLIRDFRAFSGLTPASLHAEAFRSVQDAGVGAREDSTDRTG